MADMKSIMAEIQQPLWDNWFIKEELGSGASGTVYKIEAKRGNRTDVSALKVEPITLDDVLYHDQQKKKELLEKKRRAAENETEIMYNLRKCKYIVGYEDEDIRKLNNTDGYVLLIRMEFLECLHAQVKNDRFSRSEKMSSSLPMISEVDFRQHIKPELSTVTSSRLISFIHRRMIYTNSAISIFPK